MFRRVTEELVRDIVGGNLGSDGVEGDFAEFRKLEQMRETINRLSCCRQGRSRTRVTLGLSGELDHPFEFGELDLARVHPAENSAVSFVRAGCDFDLLNESVTSGKAFVYFCVSQTGISESKATCERTMLTYHCLK